MSVSSRRRARVVCPSVVRANVPRRKFPIENEFRQARKRECFVLPAVRQRLPTRPARTSPSENLKFVRADDDRVPTSQLSNERRARKFPKTAHATVYVTRPTKRETQ